MKTVNMKMESRAGERGVALILALMVLVLLTIMAMGALFTASRSTEIAGSGRYNMEAFYAADAGINRSVQDILEYYSTYKVFPGVNSTVFNMSSVTANAATDVTPHSPVSGATTYTWPNGTTPSLDNWLNATNVYKVAYFTSESTCLGSYNNSNMCSGLRYEALVHFKSDEVRVLALTRYNDGKQADSESDRIDAALEFVVKIVTGSICDNAIFGASGAIGHRIVGNVNIHGSLTVLCEDAVALGEEGVEFGGNAGIYDNWEGGSGPGLSSAMSDRMDALALDDAGNPSYSSKVLIQTCSAGIHSGAFQMGTEDAPLDKVIIDGGLSDPDAEDQIYTDTFTTGKDSFSDYVGDNYPTFPELFDENDVLDTSTPLGQKINEDIASRDLATADSRWCSLTSSQASLYYPPGCNTTGGCKIVFDGSTNVLTSYDDAVFDLSGCAAPKLKDIEYDGKASMYYGATDLTIEGNVRVVDTKSYPSEAAMGFLTAGSMSLCPTGGGNSNCEIMGLFYAQDEVTVGMQTNIAGTVITDIFSVGNQVPDFFQVPGLEQYAPAGFDKICSGNPRLSTGGWRMVY